ncbi:MAG: type IA DNA topoisomerase [Lachnospiraceae bacterium]|nr:type IA DNA topoisomerase [Lachnospiraceae bacterium]
MGKKLIITEKPSVAREFASALKENMKKYNGYMESDNYVITWCVGHLVTMCYPDAYDPALKRWNLETIPFVPKVYKYQIIENVKAQFEIIKNLFNRSDIDVIYNAGDSGREGEYIQRLVMQEAGYNHKAELKRVWIDSQTEDEILRGIREAKDMKEYDKLSDAAYLRAKEDYLMGINFSRALTLKFGNYITDFMKSQNTVIAVGRVMTCVQGMVVKREREIRDFVKTPFYKINAVFSDKDSGDEPISYIGEWKVTSSSKYYGIPNLYKENGFLKKEDADAFIEYIKSFKDASIVNIDKKKQNKNAPLLYNLAELQNDCSKLFKISPDQTLQIAQELYEKKMTTYPRTDARVLSTAVASEIIKNLNGLKGINMLRPFVDEILQTKSYQKLSKSRYVNDKQITDHYAIIPTGQGLSNLMNLSDVSRKVYEIVVRRFLAIFYKPATYQKISLETLIGTESFFSNYKALLDEGYMKVMKYSFAKNSEDPSKSTKEAKAGEDELEQDADEKLERFLIDLKKGTAVYISDISIKEGETSPPKRYNSGSIILAMENAGQLIEDEELRAQIKGSGIGTSATRAEILKKLVNNGYLSINNKTQIITPTLLGELIFEVVNASIKPLLNPELTASWEKGLTGVANGNISSDEYLVKLNDFVIRRTDTVKHSKVTRAQLNNNFNIVKKYY